MIDRKALARVAKTAAAEMDAGRVSAAIPRALEPLNEQPEHILDLVDLLAMEGLKKRPNEKLIAAYAFILAQSLETLRYAVEREDAGIARLVERLRDHLLEGGSNGRVSPAILMLILHQFANAKLEIGDTLRELMHRLMEHDDEARAAVAARNVRHRPSLSRLSRGEHLGVGGLLEQHSLSRLSGGELMVSWWVWWLPSLSRLSGGELATLPGNVEALSLSRLSGGEPRSCGGRRALASLSRLSGGEPKRAHVVAGVRSLSRLSGGELLGS